jgi:hypothetical protein
VILLAITFVLAATGVLAENGPTWLLVLFAVAFVLSMLGAIATAPRMGPDQRALRSIDEDLIERLRERHPAPYRRGA